MYLDQELWSVKNSCIYFLLKVQRISHILNAAIKALADKLVAIGNHYHWLPMLPTTVRSKLVAIGIWLMRVMTTGWYKKHTEVLNCKSKRLRFFLSLEIGETEQVLPKKKCRRFYVKYKPDEPFAVIPVVFVLEQKGCMSIHKCTWTSISQLKVQ